MASSITLTSNKHNSRYFKLECTQESNGSAENSSTIKWKLSAVGDDTWYSTGPTKVVINGTTVYSKDRVSWDYGKFPAAQGSTSGTLVVPHASDGTKKITVKFSTAIYSSTVTEYSDSWTLDSIPRYGTVSHSLNSKTETTVKMNWSSDSTVDYLWYSKDNGSNWTGVNVTDGKSGTYTISGLSANTAYKIKTRIRRKDSQLTTDSSALSVTTYDYPYCTSSPDFVLGEKLTLKFYNPLKRAFNFYIIGNGTQIDVTYNCSSTSYTGVDSATTSVPYLYATIPNAKSAKYKVKVVYGDSVKTRDNGDMYSINTEDCAPTFTNFTYKDANSTVTAVTGNNQVLVKGLSSLSVTVPVANKMVTKLSATPAQYKATIDTINKEIAYSGTAATSATVGTITTSGTKRLYVRAYDSRGVSHAAYKDITVYDYAKPVINASVKRLNNFEAQSTLAVSGTFSRLTINGADKNAIQRVQYRYRETGGTWSSYINLNVTVSSGKFTCSNVLLSLDNSKSFEFEIVATDKLSSNSASALVDIGQAIFFISTNKKKCYINGEEVVTADNARQIKYYTQLAENTDLNKVVEIGTYRSIQKSHSDTMKNVPDGINGGFTLYVLPWTATSTNTEYRRQELIYGRMTYVRSTNDSGATWTVWSTVALLENLYPVGSIYCSATNTNPSSKLGGTWTLIDKEFSELVTSDNTSTYFTPSSTNTDGYTLYIGRSGKVIDFRLNFYNAVELTDTSVVVGAFNFAKLGIESLYYGVVYELGGTDGGNAIPVFSVNWSSGELTVEDVMCKGNTTSIVSGNSIYFRGRLQCSSDRMLDAACDKFYWKRTS